MVRKILKWVMGLCLVNIIPVMMIVFVVVFMVTTISEESQDSAYWLKFGFSQEVLERREYVLNKCEELGIDIKYASVILAIMQHETRGIGDDPMNARFRIAVLSAPGAPPVTEGSDPTNTVDRGMLFFKKCLELAEDDIEFALDIYQFDTDEEQNFYDFVKKNGGYTKDSAALYIKEGNNLRKEINYISDYPERVMRFIMLGNGVGMGNFKKLEEEFLKYQGGLYKENRIDTLKGEFDDSGLVQWCYSVALELSLPRSPQQQYDQSESILQNEARPGDLVFFGENESSISSVGIYVGDGTMFIASKITDLIDYYSISDMQDSFVGYGRVIVGLGVSEAGFISPFADTYNWRDHVSSGFTARINPISGKREFHDGLDIAVPQGTPIQVVQSGKVTFSGTARGYGYYIIVDHGNGLVTSYGHCSKLIAEAGEQVEQGQTIALVGSTGNSTGPHLHFNVIIDGQHVDPVDYLP